MLRFLVTLRHRQTGAIKRLYARGENTEDAMFNADALANQMDGITDPREDVWCSEYAEPA